MSDRTEPFDGERFGSYQRLLTECAAMESYQWFLLGMMAAWTPSGVLFALLVARPLMIGKRASLAPEPDINLDGPKKLAHIATRARMSGAPITTVAYSGFEVAAGFNATSDQGYRFAGVSSGRLGADEKKPQFGIVWKAQVVDEMVQVPSPGISSVCV
jgi:hypothetical protein